MQEKKKRKIKRKKPIAAWARWMLKLTQHICACVAILCVAALVLTSSVYVEDFGMRRWISPNVKDGEEAAGEYFVQSLYNETRTAIRLATIRTQLETDGSFDLDREIHISEYYYRKNGNSYNTGQYTYFSGAVYHLEDLIRWQQAGGLTYMGQVANNMFLTVDGKRLEELVTTNEGYIELCKQLRACMTDLRNNYDEYQNYMERYAEGETSFVYYIDMDNADGDVFTNKAFLEGANKSELQTYFDGLICAAAGTTALNYNIQGSYEIELERVAEFMSEYDYALGDDAVVYTGFDINSGASDYYATIWQAYDMYDINTVYMLIGIISGCALFYVLIALYLMCVSGRRVDKAGEEYLELKWNDSIATEIFLTWCAALGFGVTFAFVAMYEFFYYSKDNYISESGAIAIVAVTFIGSILIVESLCSLARRFKAATFLKNSIIYKYGITQLVRFANFLGGKFRKMKQTTQYYVERSGLWEKTWGLLIIEVVFYAICLFFVVWFMLYYEETLAMCTVVIMLTVVAVSAYGRLRRKVERAEIVEKIEGIVAGESCRVNVDHLSIENAALGHAVNEIGDGIQMAVEKSTKDERLKAELLTNVSHDIKTPLTSIINYVDLLKKEPMESEKAVEYINVLENKSLTLKNLIQDLIEVSKISTGNIEYEMMPLNFHELIMQAAAEYDEKFEEHCLKLVYNNSIKEAYILADSRRMWRVMENLLSNVYKYALEGTRVYVEVYRADDELVLTMKNISAKELNIQADELTERFVRGDMSRTTEGSGLGLAIAQNLVIGQGGTFRIMLDGDLFKTQITFKIHEK